MKAVDYLIKNYISVSQIAELLNTSHTTVYHWYKNVSRPNPKFKKRLEWLVEKVREREKKTKAY